MDYKFLQKMDADAYIDMLLDDCYSVNQPTTEVAGLWKRLFGVTETGQ